MKELNIIQTQLSAPKNQYNKFGGYYYRSCEDILEALKPLLAQTGCTVTITDDIVAVGDRIYVKATATITNAAGETVSNSAFAREPLDRKGSDASQITGASSSYARKYALNGLFCIDDNKDPDATNTHGQEAPAAPGAPAPAAPKRGRKPAAAAPAAEAPAPAPAAEQPAPQQPQQRTIQPAYTADQAIADINTATSAEDLAAKWGFWKTMFAQNADVVRAVMQHPCNPNAGRSTQK